MGEGCVKNPKKITIVVFKKSHLIFSDFQKEIIFLFKQNSFQIMTLLQNESKTSLIMTKKAKIDLVFDPSGVILSEETQTSFLYLLFKTNQCVGAL